MYTFVYIYRKRNTDYILYFARSKKYFSGKIFFESIKQNCESQQDSWIKAIIFTLYSNIMFLSRVDLI